MTYFFELQFWCGEHGEFIQLPGTIPYATNWQNAAECVEDLAARLIEKHADLKLEYKGKVIRPLLKAVPRTTH